MAKRRKGFSEETLLLLVLLLIGLSSLAAAMVVTVGFGVLAAARPPIAPTPSTPPTPAALNGAVATPIPTPTPTTRGAITPTPGGGATLTPTPTPTDTTPPRQVTGLKAGAGGGSGEIQLRWDASPEADVDGYNVYRSGIPGGQYSLVETVDNDQLAWVPAGTREFIDGGRFGENCYEVTAVDASGNEGPRSAEVCYFPPTPTPTPTPPVVQ